jgi:hypothetical protein
MRRVERDGGAPFDFWTYFDSIPAEDFQNHDCSAGSVRWVWRSGDGRYEHVLVNSQGDGDMFMAMVLDLHNREVLGHRLLDMKSEYGLRL